MVGSFLYKKRKENTDMKIMISQPMKGKANEQIKQERAELVEKLAMQGHEIIDTVITEEMPIECDMGIYLLAKSIEAMSKADAVIFMKGWQDARGCRIEYQIAKDYGKFIKEE